MSHCEICHSDRRDEAVNVGKALPYGKTSTKVVIGIICSSCIQELLNTKKKGG